MNSFGPHPSNATSLVETQHQRREPKTQPSLLRPPDPHRHSGTRPDNRLNPLPARPMSHDPTPRATHHPNPSPLDEKHRDHQSHRVNLGPKTRFDPPHPTDTPSPQQHTSPGPAPKSPKNPRGAPLPLAHPEGFPSQSEAKDLPDSADDRINRHTIAQPSHDSRTISVAPVNGAPSVTSNDLHNSNECTSHDSTSLHTS